MGGTGAAVLGKSLEQRIHTGNTAGIAPGHGKIAGVAKNIVTGGFHGAVAIGTHSTGPGRVSGKNGIKNLHPLAGTVNAAAVPGARIGVIGNLTFVPGDVKGNGAMIHDKR